MSAPMPMAGLTPEQAPPLVVPLSFFFAAPLALVVAAVLLLTHGQAMTLSRWLPATMAFAHLGTLGFLGSVMFGALYQVIPVVAGRAVPWIRLAHMVQVCFVMGIGALVAAFINGSGLAFWIAGIALAMTFVLFLVPVSIALVRAPAHSDSVTGLRLAVVGLALVGGFGLRLAYGRATLVWSDDWLAWTVAHMVLGLVVWVGGLLSAVSWQVLPMFYLTDPLPRCTRVATLCLVSLAAVGAACLPFFGGDAQTIACVAAPAAATIWLLHPAVAIRCLRQRRRRRADISLRFWYTGLACAPLVFATAVASLWLSDGRWPVAFGWLAIWGWAGLIVHGMLTRIVPFIVWFHRFAALVGLQPVPSMRRMLPAGRATLGYWMHMLTLGLGCAAIASGATLLIYAAAVSMALTGAALGAALIGVVGRRQ